MDIQQEIYKLLKTIGPGHMMNTAYDTAWVARLSQIGESIGEQALAWLRANQLPDGSWGAREPLYHHDRVICTLAAMTALARRGRLSDRERLRRAEIALADHIAGLSSDASGETIGFEMIVPTLLHEAKQLGALHQDVSEVIDHLTPERRAKLSVLPQKMISRFVTVAFSAEMAGLDGVNLLDVENLQERDGSVSYSPSATAYFALDVRRKDPAALDYLRRVAPEGAAPNVAPFDVFEQAWCLWNLSIAGALDDHALALCQPHLDFLEAAWTPDIGVGFVADYAPKDGDDTSLVYDVFSRLGRECDLNTVLHYEGPYHFRGFDFESTPPLSANVHILGALRQAGCTVQHPAVMKILRFLQATQVHGAFWFDKWHSSPYYVTSHIIMVCVSYHSSLVESSVEWLLSTQRHNGSWGFYMPTAEETAYCLQALALWKLSGGNIPVTVLERGAAWLEAHIDEPYPPLWLGKCLYSPKLVIRSAILSALMLMKRV